MRGLSSQQNCDIAALIREVYPRHTMKHLARVMNVPLDTARHWLFRKFTPDFERTCELCLKLLGELDQQERHRQEVRRQLETIGHAAADSQTRALLAGEAVRRPRLHRRGAAAG
jgi:hypothetical protein